MGLNVKLLAFWNYVVNYLDEIARVFWVPSGRLHVERWNVEVHAVFAQILFLIVESLVKFYVVVFRLIFVLFRGIVVGNFETTFFLA